MNTGGLQVEHEESLSGQVISLSGPLTVRELARLQTELTAVPRNPVIDLSGVTRIDTGRRLGARRL
uniref:STAS domain-containing protein n=1 Tax=Alloyangia mangrovi TaxID=1779329 RepID=A0A2A3JMY3_9RHOB